jgi:hypothetical protein
MLKQVNTDTEIRGVPRQLAPLCVALGLWCGLILLFCIQIKVSFSEPWSDVLTNAGFFWLPRILFLPIVVWISLRFPFDRPKVLFQIGIHLAVCAAILTISQIISHFFLPLPPTSFLHQGPPAFDHRGPPPMALRLGPDMMIYLVTMSASVAFAHFRKSQERERHALELETRLAQAKLQALRMQINPHFLFNTLNAISTLVHTNPRAADDMITDLGELFRGSLECSDEQEIPLARELELLGRYLAIEQRRFGERLTAEQKVAPEILTALVPTLILQPLVENAIRHGIEPHASPGIIAIRCRRHGDKIRLSVSDNGKKRAEFAASAENKLGRQGVGLANTQARLQQLYGSEQSVSIAQGEPGGWTVEVQLPYRTAAKRS